MEKDNQGVLFKNEEKESDTHPDYSGTVTIGGKEMYIKGWINVSKKGFPFMKLRLQLKNEQSENQNAKSQKVVTDIPF
tara:strand:+ start:1036 stop:1269 length:234 start_codon:yes stop_codon:yes gene_type:complete